jgi:hypothetical protein
MSTFLEPIKEHSSLILNRNYFNFEYLTLKVIFRELLENLFKNVKFRIFSPKFINYPLKKRLENMVKICIQPLKFILILNQQK